MSCDTRLAWPHPLPPRFETLDRQALLAQILGRLPGFVPEWRVEGVEGAESPGGADAGLALLAVCARYLDILGDA